MLRRRVGLTAAGVLAALTVLGVPSSTAAATTRVVDDDGKATATSCDATAAAPSSIQAAVNLAQAGDTILVCPGRYNEAVDIGPAKTGLTLRSKGSWKAVIVAPQMSFQDLISIRADRVTFLGFRIFVPADARCARVGAVVAVSSRDVVVRGNRIGPTGPDTFHPCGYNVGIAVVGEEGGRRASASVLYNLVHDFNDAGINAIYANVLIARNSVQFDHADDECVVDHMEEVDCPAGTGIRTGGSNATVYWNHVWSGGPNADSDVPYRLTSGISLSGTRSGETIAARDNWVRHNYIGIAVTFATGATATGNTALDSSFVGLYASEVTDSLFESNTASDGATGIRVYPTSAGNTFRDNEAIGNELDCEDMSSGSGTFGTANTWTGNVGVTSTPVGICLPAPPI